MLARICALLFLFELVALHAQPFKMRVSAKSAILYNPDNGAILFEKNSSQPHYPASILKIATAFFVLDAKKLPMETVFVADDGDLKTIHASIKQKDIVNFPPHLLEHDGVVMGLKKGESYPLSYLMHGLILASANDAANVIARHCSGSVETFMDEMNLFLREKGIHQTRFQNPHGLYHPAQMTSAFDMAKITGLAIQNPKFLDLVGATSFEMEGKETIKNANRLLKKGAYFYPKCIGAKTGYISSSGFNLVAIAQEGERRLVAVLLGCETAEERYKEAISLFERAFRETSKKRVLFSTDHEPFLKTLSKSDRPLKAKIDREISVSIFPSEEQTFYPRVTWMKKQPPIQLGEKVGELEIVDGKGNLVASRQLFAENFVKKKKGKKWIVLVGALCGTLFFLQRGKKRRKLFKR